MGLNLFIVKIRFRINHLLQEVEQVDGHAEVDGRHWLDEVEPYVRIKNLCNLLLILKLTWKQKLWSKQFTYKVMKNTGYRLTLIASDVECQMSNV